MGSKVHKSRLAGFIVDCQTNDLDSAAEFWAAALGAPVKERGSMPENPYVALDTPANRPYVSVQAVEHDSRIHIDVETDNIAAEVRRLESLGAEKISAIKDWVVMEAPTGQRFCVVNVSTADFQKNANSWRD